MYKCKQVRKKKKLLVNDSEKNIVMFSCKTNLQFLGSYDVLKLKGNSNQHRSFFHQLLTIHGLSNGHYVPLPFLLLANKYQTVSEAAKLGVNVFPTTAYAEFETAIHNAVKTAWPGWEVKSTSFPILDRAGNGKYNFWNSASSMERQTQR
jgi:hypothetical protein